MCNGFLQVALSLSLELAVFLEIQKEEGREVGVRYSVCNSISSDLGPVEG